METPTENNYNCVVLLGPTAVGKTSLGVRLAHHFNMPIISADSRQTYKGLDLGSGKDLDEYTIIEKQPDGSTKKITVPYYLIDVATLDTEYNVFNYQQDFYKTFIELTKNNSSTKKTIPLVVGGTGMYLDSIIRGYDFMPVPENKKFRDELEAKSLEELGQMLMKLKPELHNKSDLLIKERIVRAIEIELYMKSPECEEERKKLTPRPEINALVIGTTIPRDELHKNISIRLKERLDAGMIEEVKNLHDIGYSWERLEKLGLEYRFVSEYLEKKIKTKEELFRGLNHAISQFAKRQETWFRGMEKKGVQITWLPKVVDKEAKYQSAVSLINSQLTIN